MSRCLAFKMCGNGLDELIVMQKVDCNVVFVFVCSKFLRRKVIALIVQQVLYKHNILVPPSLLIDRFVFNIHVSVISQNKFTFQWIFIIATTQFLKIFE